MPFATMIEAVEHEIRVFWDKKHFENEVSRLAKSMSRQEAVDLATFPGGYLSIAECAAILQILNNLPRNEFGEAERDASIYARSQRDFILDAFGYAEDQEKKVDRQKLSGQCSRCAHYIEGKRPTCKAFPEEIPWDILGGWTDHTSPYISFRFKDNGITFEPKPKAPIAEVVKI